MRSNYQGLHKLNDLVFLVNKPIIGKKGIHFQKLLKDWINIIGEDIASYAVPIKITTIRTKKIPQNILFIATNNTALSVELFYQIEVIKEQINLYFGYEYIQQIKIIQASFSSSNKIEPDIIRKLSSDQQEKARQLVELYDTQDNIKEILQDFANLIAYGINTHNK